MALEIPGVLELLALHEGLDVASQFFHPSVADGNAEVVAGDFFQVVASSR